MPPRGDQRQRCGQLQAALNAASAGDVSCWPTAHTGHRHQRARSRQVDHVRALHPVDAIQTTTMRVASLRFGGVLIEAPITVRTFTYIYMEEDCLFMASIATPDNVQVYGNTGSSASSSGKSRRWHTSVVRHGRHRWLSAQFQFATMSPGDCQYSPWRSQLNGSIWPT